MSAKLQAKAAFEGSIFGALNRQVFHRVPPIPSSIHLRGQTAIVTGSSSGLGKECARQLLQLQLGYLILAVRSQPKGDTAMSELQAQFPSARIEVWLLDMESHDSVQDFATRCQELERLDVAILNAGLGKQHFTRSGSNHDGREVTIQVNYLATVLLAILLTPMMKARNGGTPGRISLVTSDMSHMAKLDTKAENILDSLDDAKTFDGMMQYGKSKLILNMGVSKLVEAIKPDECIINLGNPSAVKGTGLMREAEALLPRLYVGFFNLVMGRKVVDGARQYLHSALVLGKESHGSYCDWKIRPYPVFMYTEVGHRMTEKLWDETLKELSFAGVETTFGLLKK